MGTLEASPLRAVTTDEINTLWRDGAVCLRGIIPPDWIAVLEDGVQRWLASDARFSLSDFGAGRTEGAARPKAHFYGGTDHWKTDEDCRRFACESPLPGIVGALLRSVKVNLYEDSILAKEPGTVEKTMFHQDLPYFHVEGTQICTTWVPLDPVTRETGSLLFVKGSHTWKKTYRPNYFVQHESMPDTEGEDAPDYHEGVVFRTGVLVGAMPEGSKVANLSHECVAADALLADFDAVLLTGGAEQPRDLPAPGREMDGVHFAMEFLAQQNRRVAGETVDAQISATGKHVIVIGGGDTGSDCVGTSNRHGAQSVTQFEVMPMPPEHEDKAVTWPYWPYKLRTSSSHQEGCERVFAVSTKEFLGEKGKVTGIRTVHVEMKEGKFVEVPGSEQTLPADLVLFAMGFVSPVQTVLQAFGVKTDGRANASAPTEGASAYRTNVDKVFAAGDMRRGQSLVVWAIREGRQAARAVDEFLMGGSTLPR